MRLRVPVADEDLTRFEELIARRLAGEPIAYITGVREFMGLQFSVGPGVLVPRPETETMVEWAANWLCARGPSVAIDVGTGSGSIVLSLAHALQVCDRDRFLGCDISTDALDYAVRNRTLLGLDYRVDLIRGDLLNWLGAPVDLVLANLPYLTPGQVEENPEIQNEPEFALISGNDGFGAIARLIDDLPRVLKPGGAAILEIDPTQAERAVLQIESTLPAALVSTMQDLAGFDRFVLAETA